jgi:hypothetical protein
MDRVGSALASATLALSCGVGAYAAFGGQGQEELHGSTRVVGPFHLSPALLVVGLMVTTGLGAIALFFLVRSGLIFGRAGLVPLAASGAAAVTGWGWRELTAAYAVEPSLLPTLAVAAVVLAWLAAWIGIRASRRDSAVTHRCLYCARPDTLVFGDVHIVSANEHERTVLLQCPRCGCLHAGAADRPDLADPITEADARELFPSTW